MTRRHITGHNEFDWMEVRLGPGRPPRLSTSKGDRLAVLQAENAELRNEVNGLRLELRRQTDARAAGPGDSASRTLEEAERDHIVAVLERCSWKIKGSGAAAELLGLNPGTLYSRMRKLGVVRPDR